MKYGLQFTTGNGRTYYLDEIGVGVYLGQIAQYGVGTAHANFPELVGNAVTILACNNGGSTRPANGFTSYINVNPANMSVSLTVAAYGGLQQGTPVFIYDLYARFA